MAPPSLKQRGAGTNVNIASQKTRVTRSQSHEVSDGESGRLRQSRRSQNTTGSGHTAMSTPAAFPVRELSTAIPHSELSMVVEHDAPGGMTPNLGSNIAAKSAGRTSAISGSTLTPSRDSHSAISDDQNLPSILSGLISSSQNLLRLMLPPLSSQATADEFLSSLAIPGSKEMEYLSPMYSQFTTHHRQFTSGFFIDVTGCNRIFPRASGQARFKLKVVFQQANLANFLVLLLTQSFATQAFEFWQELIEQFLDCLPAAVIQSEIAAINLEVECRTQSALADGRNQASRNGPSNVDQAIKNCFFNPNVLQIWPKASEQPFKTRHKALIAAYKGIKKSVVEKTKAMAQLSQLYKSDLVCKSLIWKPELVQELLQCTINDTDWLTELLDPESEVVLGTSGHQSPSNIPDAVLEHQHNGRNELENNEGQHVAAAKSSRIYTNGPFNPQSPDSKMLFSHLINQAGKRRSIPAVHSVSQLTPQPRGKPDRPLVPSTAPAKQSNTTHFHRKGLPSSQRQVAVDDRVLSPDTHQQISTGSPYNAQPPSAALVKQSDATHIRQSRLSPFESEATANDRVPLPETRRETNTESPQTAQPSSLALARPSEAASLQGNSRLPSQGNMTGNDPATPSDTSRREHRANSYDAQPMIFADDEVADYEDDDNNYPHAKNDTGEPETADGASTGEREQEDVPKQLAAETFFSMSDYIADALHDLKSQRNQSQALTPVRQSKRPSIMDKQQGASRVSPFGTSESLGCSQDQSFQVQRNPMGGERPAQAQSSKRRAERSEQNAGPAKRTRVEESNSSAGDVSRLQGSRIWGGMCKSGRLPTCRNLSFGPRKANNLWTKEETDCLIDMIELSGCSWSAIMAKDAESGNLLQERDPVSLRDRARNIKFSFLKMGTFLPRNFEKVGITNYQAKGLENAGIQYDKNKGRRVN